MNIHETRLRAEAIRRMLLDLMANHKDPNVALREGFQRPLMDKYIELMTEIDEHDEELYTGEYYERDEYPES